MPGPSVIPVEGDAELPRAVDVVVIGGGIIGCSTALELAERGHRVALCEKGGIAQEQSSRNWGWVRISRRDPREVPLMVEALRIWQTLDARTGRETGYRQAGIVFMCENETRFTNYDRWRRHLAPWQIDSRMLGRSELKAMFPDANLDVEGALYTPGDGRAEPQRVGPAIAEAARAHGAAILTGCAVRGVETRGGAISGVVTEKGPIACSAVVLAGGAWSSLFCRNADLDLPQLGVVNHVLRTEPIEGGPEQAIWCSDVALRKRQDGGYTIADGSGNTVEIVPDSFRYARRFLPAFRQDHNDLHLRFGARFFEEFRRKKRWSMDEESPFEHERVFDPKPSQKILDRLIGAAARRFPALEGARVAQRWAGCIDVTPDAVPVISAVDAVPGFHIATGFSGHGFGIGPGAGRLMADIVTNGAPCVDPQAFRFSRFTDGSKLAIDDGF